MHENSKFENNPTKSVSVEKIRVQEQQKAGRMTFKERIAMTVLRLHTTNWHVNVSVPGLHEATFK